MGLFKRRVKSAVKCLFGLQEASTPITTHEYHLIVDDIKKLEGMVVFVTGGTGAIGSAICYELAAMGAIIGVGGRDEVKLQNMLDLVKKGSPKVVSNLVPVVIDVNKDREIEDAIEKFAHKYGKLDVMINNAGGQPGIVGSFSKHLFNQTIEHIDLILDTNLRGTILCSRIASKIMAEQKFGHIISMASVIGMNGKAGYCDYAATKAAIIGFTKSLALEMAEYGIRVNCISPGLINQTPFDSGSEERYTQLTALKRAGYTKEIADAVVFLIRDEYITGQNIVVDGGRSLGLFGDN